MEEGKFYHIYNRGNNKENIFLNKDNYIFFLQRYKHYINPIADTYAYCLMPNHFHFLIKPKESVEQTSKVLKTFEVSVMSPLEKAFKDFFISYAKAFNKQNNRTGSLFQYKFKRKKVDDDSYLSSIIAYIHLNSIKAKLCSNPFEWEFSSYNAYLSSKESSVKKDEIIKWFGNTEDFVKFHNDYKEEYSHREYLIDN